MADLSPEEANQWLGGSTPTQAEIQAEYDLSQRDPVAWWWSTFMEGKNPTGKLISASGGGPKPLRNSNEASALAGSFGLNRDVNNATEMDALFRAGANAGPRANPYNTGVADQSRAGQLALMQQMRAGLDGPSLAAMQGQRAFAQSGQQALMRGGRAGMLGAQQVGGGLAGDVGQARLAEVMRGQGSIGGAAGNLRGADLRSAGAQMDAGLQQRKQDDLLRQFYASQGANLRGARDQATTNREATRLQLLSKGNKRDMETGMNMLNSGASLFAGMAV